MALEGKKSAACIRVLVGTGRGDLKLDKSIEEYWRYLSSCMDLDDDSTAGII